MDVYHDIICQANLAAHWYSKAREEQSTIYQEWARFRSMCSRSCLFTYIDDERAKQVKIEKKW